MSIVSSSDDPLYPEPQAAEYLSLKPQTLAVWRSTGRYNLPYIRVGRLIRYRKSDLDRWLRDRTVRHTGESADQE